MDAIDSTTKGEAKENVQPIVNDLNAKASMNLKKGLVIGFVIGVVLGGTVIHFLKSSAKAVGVTV